MFLEKDIDWNWAAEAAAEKGNGQLLHSLVQKGANNLGNMLIFAMNNKNKVVRNEIIHQILSYEGTVDAYSMYSCASSAVGEGDLELIKFFHQVYKTRGESGSFPWDMLLHDAAFAGHKHIVDYALENGATYYTGAIRAACCKNNKELVLFFSEKAHPNPWNDVLDQASFEGHMDLVQLAIDNGANNWNKAMGQAACGGHRELVEFLIEKGANDWDHGLQEAMSGAKDEMVSYFINKGAKDWRKHLKNAVEWNRTRWIEVFSEKYNDKNSSC